MSTTSIVEFTESKDDYFVQESLDNDVLNKALNSGVDLREYSKSIESQLYSVENQSIQDYINESKNIATLHNQIVDCDNILERMENMLLSFKSDLGNISSEIESLQQQSVKMNLKLKNRLSVKDELSQFVEDVVIPEHMITTILESPVTDLEFLSQVLKLEDKINFLKHQNYRDAKSCSEVKEVVDKLKLKAVAKIRDFHLERINQFKKPMANYQMIQNVLVKFKFYYKFLYNNNAVVAQEIKDEYVSTMSRVLFSYMKVYSNRLMSLQYNSLANKDDLMGHEDVGVKPSLHSLFSKVSMKDKASVFGMGDRFHALDSQVDSPIIIPHNQQQSDSKYPYEALFRSEQLVFLENACREYVFLKEFLMLDSTTECNEMFKHVTGKTVAMLIKGVEDSVMESYDTICLFLCLHIVHKFSLICKDRSVNVLEKYWDSLLNPVWSRFQMVMLMHIHSIRDLIPQKSKIVDQRPHYITRRYAEFAGGIIAVRGKLAVNSNRQQSSPRSRVSASNTTNLSEQISDRLMTELRIEVERFISRAASTAFTVEVMDQMLFLINNYDVILTVITELSSCDSPELESFKTLLECSSSDYVEQILQKHFPSLVAYVQKAEILLQERSRGVLDHHGGGQYESLKYDTHQLLKNFNSNLKVALNAVNKEILSSFQNLHLGTDVLQQALTRFMQYYGRLYKALSDLKNVLTVDPSIEVLPPRVILAEVKKYKPNF